MSGGGFAGSKVRREKLTGCLVIVTAGGSLAGRLHERAHQLSKPGSAASNTDEMRRRDGNVFSALILRESARLKLRICGADDGKDTLNGSLQKAKQQRKLDAAAGRQIHSILQLRWVIQFL
jgi:hypothetical protein